MASVRAIADQRAALIKRGDAVDMWLAAELGIEIPPPAMRVAQPQLAEILELERQITIREAIREAFTSKAGGGGVDPSALDGTIADVKEYIESVDDPKALSMLHAAESEGKGRKGVLAVIEGRQAALEAEALEEPEE